MRPVSRQVLLTALAALAGLGVAVVLAILTSHLSTQRIGLAGEPVDAGRRLVAPARSTTTAADRTTTRPARAVTAAPATTPAPAPVPTTPAPAPARTTPAERHENERTEPHRDSDD